MSVARLVAVLLAATTCASCVSSGDLDRAFRVALAGYEASTLAVFYRDQHGHWPDDPSDVVNLPDRADPELKAFCDEVQFHKIGANLAIIGKSTEEILYIVSAQSTNGHLVFATPGGG